MSGSCSLDTYPDPLIWTCPVDSVSSAARSLSQGRLPLSRHFASLPTGRCLSMMRYSGDWAVFALHPLPWLPSALLFAAALREEAAATRLAKHGSPGACRAACCCTYRTKIQCLSMHSREVTCLHDYVAFVS